MLCILFCINLNKLILILYIWVICNMETILHIYAWISYGIGWWLRYLTYNRVRHMVYKRVSNMFDYSLHVLVPCDRHLDISMLSIHICIAFYYLFIHIHSYHNMRFSCVFVFRDVFMWFFFFRFLLVSSSWYICNCIREWV